MTPADGTFVASDDGTSWRFEGALTLDNAVAVLTASEGLALPKSGRVDLSAMSTADSAALAVLFALKRRARAHRHTLAFEGMPASLASLARVYGVDELV